MAKQVVAWKCNYCGKASINHSAINRHEESCANNPDRRHCKTCKNSGWNVVEHHEEECSDVWGTTPAWDSKELWCFALDKPMRDKPWLMECDYKYEIHYGYDEPLEEPRPFTCQHYEQKKAAT